MGNAEEGRRGSFLIEKEAEGIVTADLPSGAALARLSGKGSPLWRPVGVHRSFAHPPLGREGQTWGQ